ncbi:MAG: AbrB/MazE/SpoVT family DNA-binding domain-containing protein [Thermoproteota archaeon]
MSLSVTKTSSKGQVVIPKKIREKLGLEKGTLLLAYATGDKVVLKKLSQPEKGIFSEFSKPVRKKITALGIDRNDVDRAIREVRKA